MKELDMSCECNGLDEDLSSCPDNNSAENLSHVWRQGGNEL